MQQQAFAFWSFFTKEKRERERERIKALTKTPTVVWNLTLRDGVRWRNKVCHRAIGEVMAP